MNVTWEQEFVIRTYEVDLNNKLKVNSLFNFMQIVASNHAETLNVGFDELHKQGLFWVLTRVNLKIYKYPSYEEKIKVLTWPKGVNKILALRDFIITDAKGDKIADATSAWVQIDLQKKRPQRIKNLPDIFSTLSHQHAIETVPEKIPTLNDIKQIYDKRVGYTDLDINAHVNNSKYVEWTLDALDQNEINRKISEFKINFNTECQLGDKIHIFKGYDEDDKVYFIGKKEDETIAFKSLLEWE